MYKFKEKYCCFCSKKLESKKLFDGSAEQYCKACDYVFFPKVTSAIIALITFDKYILLSRGVGWEHPYWGFIAGHLKPGESAEEAVEREVMEEVNLKIVAPKFLTSYHHVTDRNILMIAFHAKAKTKKIKISQELTAAKWFDFNESLPIKLDANVRKILHKYFKNKNQ